MTRRRWIADEVSGNSASLLGEHAAHLARVLRAQIGQEFDIATGNAVRLGKVVSVSEARVEFALGEEIAVQHVADLTLLLAIFKFDRMEWALEKCTEIGVSKIVPLIARRTESHLAAAAAKRHERWQRIARQASEQSRRAEPPEISPPLKFKEALDAINARPGNSGVVQEAAADAPAVNATGPSAANIVLAESESNIGLRDALPATANRSVLAIGPEGGWTSDELRWFDESGWKTASLGPTILRAETAAIVATALALDALR
jgi:16S rRNA (uracil1498-N3)-methyltransferase